ncbi:MAG: DNA-directed RNA polymerase subunit omega [Clostridia bacterium]
MLSKPNISEIMDKVGSRYESALAIAKRARQITRSRIATADTDIKDPVDKATSEICDGNVFIKKDGKYTDLNKDKDDVEKVLPEILEEK